MNNWISCKDQLPEHGIQVLTFDGEYLALASAYIRPRKKIEWLDVEDELTTDKTHWMPLPKPPK